MKNMNNQNLVLRAILAVFMFLLSGCLFTAEDDGKQAGIDDFDNMVHAFIEKGDKWDDQVAPKKGANLLENSKPSHSPFLKSSSRVPLQPSSGLYKVALFDSVLKLDFSDTS